MLAGVKSGCMCLVQEVTVTRAEADQARAAAEAATPRMQATTRFGVTPPARTPPVPVLLFMHAFHGLNANPLTCTQTAGSHTICINRCKQCYEDKHSLQRTMWHIQIL